MARSTVSVRGSRPLGALVSQGIVAGSSLVLQFIALRALGASGLGTFSLLFGVLITVNSIQSGWIGDSLTVLDRFEPGIRRALLYSQIGVILIVAVVSTLLALPVGGVSATGAVLFGLASVMWVIEETFRRILIARREFWQLVVNDASFAVGSLGMVTYVWLSGKPITIESLILALFAGAVVAIGVGVVQLPRIEVSPGLLGPARLRELSSFAFWRAAQVGIRPGSQALVRAIVATVASLEALGHLETARLLLAPVLTAVNGAGVYLLPTYSGQAKRGERFRPSVTSAMAVIGALAGIYGLIALALRSPLIHLLSDGSTVVTATAMLSWSLYSIGFGVGIPVGNAIVARGGSRLAFNIRCVDGAVGVVVAAALALGGWIDAVPAGLAVGTFVGAALLARRLARPDDTELRIEASPATVAEPTLLAPAFADPPWIWQPRLNTHAPEPIAVATSRPVAAADGPTRTRRSESWSESWSQRMLWLVPIVMIVATEYKLRRRNIDEALSGTIDPLIAIELMIYGLIGLWALWRLAPRRPQLTPLTVMLWGYIATTAVSAMYSSFPLLGLARAVQLLIIGAVIHLLTLDGTVATITKLLHAWIVLISLSILAGLAYVAPTTNAQVGRFTWLSVHSVSAGSMLAISVCVLFGCWLAAGGQRLLWARPVYAVLLVVHLAFLLLTRTRGSIGGAFISLAVMAWVWSGNRMKPQLLLGSLVAGGAAVLAFGRQILDFLTRGESAAEIGTFNRRTEIWTLAWDSFLHHPLQGLGLTSAKGVFFDETGLGGGHNAFINVMIDTGLVGLVWWIGLILAIIVTLDRQWSHRRVPPTQAGAVGTARADHLIVLGILVASLLNSVTTEGLGAGVNVSAIWLFIVAAWLVVLERRPTSGSTPSMDSGQLFGEVRNRAFESVP